ncbi:DUF6011 domain-containing protein [Anaerobacillus sp. MEB173]|uniref:DUF6011 domain-containing protein n=1 Tax=Anaerobacillus sp. MEB173 TaxID=3383345 RepID=UPI003F93D354
MNNYSEICTVCRRKLKDPKSIAIGMGPTCAKKADMEGVQTDLIKELVGDDDGKVLA